MDGMIKWGWYALAFVCGTLLLLKIITMIPVRILWGVNAVLLAIALLIIPCFRLFPSFRSRIARLLGAEDEFGEEIPRDSLARKSVETAQTFTIRSVADFVAYYRLHLSIEAESKTAFKEAKLWRKETQSRFAATLNEGAVVSFLCSHSYRFHFRMKLDSKLVDELPVFEVKADKFFDKDGQICFSDISPPDLDGELRGMEVVRDSCRSVLKRIEQNIFPEELIDRNYAMLSEELKKEIEESEPYRAYDEALAVAALKRRSDFVRSHYRQEHNESAFVSIDTEQAGRGLKISWKVKRAFPEPCYLMGFRKTGGFCTDYYDEEKNGILIVQSLASGEATEFLKEGEVYFYSFFLRPWKHESNSRWPVARFQVTAGREEMDAIQVTIRRIEKKELPEVNVPDPDKEHIAQALKEIGLYVEFDTSLDAKYRVLKRNIENSDYSDQEKAEKLSRLDDVVASIREKYEQ